MVSDRWTLATSVPSRETNRNLYRPKTDFQESQASMSNRQWLTKDSETEKTDVHPLFAHCPPIAAFILPIKEHTRGDYTSLIRRQMNRETRSRFDYTDLEQQKDNHTHQWKRNRRMREDDPESHRLHWLSAIAQFHRSERTKLLTSENEIKEWERMITSVTQVKRDE